MSVSNLKKAFFNIGRIGSVHVHIVKGVDNVHADALSRSNHLDKPTKAENEEYQKDNEVGELKITYATDLEGYPAAA